MKLTHFSKLFLFSWKLAEFQMETGKGRDIVFIVTTLTLEVLSVSLLTIKAIVGSVSPGGEGTK